MQDLRIGVIGVGGRGGLARNAHDPDNGVRLVAGADPDEATFGKFKELHGDDVFTTTDYREVLARDDVDAVFITAPDFLHEEMAIAALRAEKAVYLEKPMAIRIEGCDLILETARETGTKLYLGHNMRHSDYILKMKALIDEGAIGEVQAVWCRHFIAYGADAYYKDWHSEQKYATSLLLQKAAHDIDVIHWLAGGYTSAVVGMGKLSVYNRCTGRRSPDEKGDASWHDENWPPLEQKKLSPIVDVEDLSSIMMQMDNGVQANYMQCHYTPDSCRNYTFIGTEGRIENNHINGESVIMQYSSRRSRFGSPDTIHKIFPRSGGHGGADPKIVGEFVAFVRENKPATTSPVAARFSVATGVRGAESIRTGNSLLEIPSLPQDLIDYFENGQAR